MAEYPIQSRLTDLQGDFQSADEQYFEGKVKSISYSGPDITALAYIPLTSDPTEGATALSNSPSRVLVLGTLQTLSLSSTRSLGPVRVLGRTNPIGYTRGARTFAGTLVFAIVNKDPFSAIYRPDVVESYADSSTSLFIDQLPPFNIHITAVSEVGDVATQVIYGITLSNFGTTYSVDDIYTEATYTYVAEDATPLLSQKVHMGQTLGIQSSSPLDLIQKLYTERLGTTESVIGPRTNRYTVRRDLVDSLENSHGLDKRFFWGNELAINKQRFTPSRRWKVTQYSQ